MVCSQRNLLYDVRFQVRLDGQFVNPFLLKNYVKPKEKGKHNAENKNFFYTATEI